MSYLLSRAWADSVLAAESALPARNDLPSFTLRRMLHSSAARQEVLGWVDERFEAGRVVQVAQTHPGYVDLTLHADVQLWQALDGGHALCLGEPGASGWADLRARWPRTSGGRVSGAPEGAALRSVLDCLGMQSEPPIPFADVAFELSIAWILEGFPGGAVQFVDRIQQGRLVTRNVSADATVDVWFRTQAEIFCEYLVGRIPLEGLMQVAQYAGPPSSLVTLLGILEAPGFVHSWGFAQPLGQLLSITLGLLADPRRVALRRVLHARHARLHYAEAATG